MMKRLLMSTVAASLLTMGSVAGIALAEDNSNTANPPAAVVPQPSNSGDSGAAMAPGADTTNGTGSTATDS